jgi:8-oxo-dGTP pyrophosphatase MutT (NUDIX family)
MEPRVHGSRAVATGNRGSDQAGFGRVFSAFFLTFITMIKGDVMAAATDTRVVISVADLMKDAADLHDPNPVDAEHVYQQLLQNFPPKAITWVKAIPWIGPIEIPLDRIDWDSEPAWAASHQKKRVQHFERKLERGEPLHPVVFVQVPGNDKAVIIDGHHRALACQKRGKPVKGYVGFAPSDKPSAPWFQTHVYQFHQGADSLNKMPAGPRVTISVADLVKVGKKGYIHGWIFVGVPADPVNGTAGDKVIHPAHGSGVITSKDTAGIHARFSDGIEATLSNEPYDRAWRAVSPDNVSSSQRKLIATEVSKHLDLMPVNSRTRITVQTREFMSSGGTGTVSGVNYGLASHLRPANSQDPDVYKIYLHPKLIEKDASQEDLVKDWLSPGGKGKYAALQHTVAHEMGHALVRSLGDDKTKELEDKYGSPAISRYGATKPSENLAEAYASQSLGYDNPAGREIISILQQRNLVHGAAGGAAKNQRLTITQKNAVRSSVAAFMLLQSLDQDGKRRYLLQYRSDDATWGLPGGMAHTGETSWETADREVKEELGSLPSVSPAAEWQLENDAGDPVTVYLVKTTMFSPASGQSDAETLGWAWLKRKQVPEMETHPLLEKLWDELDFGDDLLGGTPVPVKKNFPLPTGNTTVRYGILEPVAEMSLRSDAMKAVRSPTLWEFTNDIDAPDMMKIGAEGYIHGWVCINPPCGHVGDKVTHPEHGNGVIRGVNSDRSMIARFDDGTFGRLGTESKAGKPAINAPNPVKSPKPADASRDSVIKPSVFTHKNGHITRSDEIPAAWNRLTSTEQEKLKNNEIHIAEGSDIYSVITSLGINVSANHENYGVATGLTHEGKILVTRKGLSNGDLDHEFGHALDQIGGNRLSHDWGYVHADAKVRKETRDDPRLSPHFNAKENQSADKERFAELFSQYSRGIRQYDLGVKLSLETSQLVTDFFDKYREVDNTAIKQRNRAYELVSFAEKTVSGKIKISLADLVKVGPEGYIHGYICVRPPCGQYHEASFNSSKGTVEHDGNRIGKMRKNADGTYSMTHLDGEVKDKLTARYATRADAAKSIALYHNLRALQNSTGFQNADATHELAGAIAAMRNGDHEGAARHLDAVASDAGKRGDRVLSTHASELAAAIKNGPKLAGVIITPEPRPAAIDEPFDASQHIAAMQEILNNPDVKSFKGLHVNNALVNAINALDSDRFDNATRSVKFAEDTARYHHFDTVADQIHVIGSKLQADHDAYEAHKTAAMPSGWEKDLRTNPAYIKPQTGFKVQAFGKNDEPLSLHPAAEKTNVPRYFATQHDVDDFVRNNTSAYRYDPDWKAHGKNKPTAKVNANRFRTTKIANGNRDPEVDPEDRFPGETVDYGDQNGDTVASMPVRFSPRVLPPGADRWAHQPDPEPSDEKAVHQRIAAEIRSQFRQQDKFVPSVTRNTQITVTKAPQEKPGRKQGKSLADFQASWPDQPFHGVMRVTPDVFSAVNEAEASRVLKDAVNHGWWVPTDSDHTLADNVIAHETGHGVAAKAWGSTRSVPQDMNFWVKFAKAAGIENEAIPDSFRENDVVVWLNVNRPSLEKAISQYGAVNTAEMMAELWAEYTLSSHPRPPAQLYGDAAMAAIKAKAAV